MDYRNQKLIADARSRTPDRWYYNQYLNGTLSLSLGFSTKERADEFAENVQKCISRVLKQGREMQKGISIKVEQAKKWSVNGNAFDTFADALYYKWTECPDKEIKGIF